MIRVYPTRVWRIFIIRLPCKEEMLKRLLSVDSGPEFVDNIYPSILIHAGEEKNPTEIISILEAIIDEYGQKTKLSMLSFYDRIPDLIDALVVDGKDAEFIKKYWEDLIYYD